MRKIVRSHLSHNSTIPSGYDTRYIDYLAREILKQSAHRYQRTECLCISSASCTQIYTVDDAVCRTLNEARNEKMCLQGLLLCVQNAAVGFYRRQKPGFI